MKLCRFGMTRFFLSLISYECLSLITIIIKHLKNVDILYYYMEDSN